jgi:phage antirepressor YoqD-like protein
MRNSEIVRNFKKALIRAFRALVNQVAVPLVPRQDMYRVAGLEIALPRTLGEALRGMATLADKAEEQAAKIQVLEPKAAFHDQVADAKDGQSIAAVARVFGTGQNRLFRWMREKHILLPNNLPLQEHLDAGRFRLIEQKWKGKSGPHLSTKTLVTGKGLIWLQKKWEARNNPEPARPTLNLQEVMAELGIPESVAKNLLSFSWAQEPNRLLPVTSDPEPRWDKAFILHFWAQIPPTIKDAYRTFKG